MVFSKHKWNLSLKSKKRGPWHPSLWGESPEAPASEGGEAGLALRSPAYANKWGFFWNGFDAGKILWSLNENKGRMLQCLKQRWGASTESGTCCFSPQTRAETGLRKVAELVKLVTLYWVQWSEVAQSCLTLRDPVDCSLPGSSVYGIFQARILEWVAISFSRVSPWPRDQTQVSCTASRLFTIWATKEGPLGRSNIY